MNAPLRPIALSRWVVFGLSLCLAWTQAVPLSASPGEWRWLPPLESGGFVLLEPFRAPPHEYGPGHRGIDIAAQQGAIVRAPAGGTISFAGTVVDRPVVSVRVDDHTVYSMEPVSSDVQQGDSVGIGSPIGTVRGGGHCESHCLHLGVRVDGSYVNPVRYFVNRPVLLPW